MTSTKSPTWQSTFLLSSISCNHRLTLFVQSPLSSPQTRTLNTSTSARETESLHGKQTRTTILPHYRLESLVSSMRFGDSWISICILSVIYIITTCQLKGIESISERQCMMSDEGMLCQEILLGYFVWVLRAKDATCALHFLL